METEKNSNALALGIVSLTISIISLIVCGWLGFIGAVLGIVAQCIGKKGSPFVTGLLGTIVGLIGGFLWLVIISML